MNHRKLPTERRPGLYRPVCSGQAGSLKSGLRKDASWRFRFLLLHGSSPPERCVSPVLYSATALYKEFYE